MKTTFTHLLRPVLPLAILTITGTMAHAAPIAIANAGFEEFFTDSSMTTPLALTAGQYTSGFQTTTSQSGSTAGFAPGWFNVGNFQGFIQFGTGSFGAPFAPVGSLYGGQASTGDFAQILSTDVASNSIYTLSLLVAPGSTNGTPDLTPLLLYGTTNNGLTGGTALTLASSTKPAVVFGSFVTWTYTFTTGTVPTSDPLAIRFSSVVGGNPQSLIDNVQLTVVPEPSSVALLMLGGLGVIVMMRRRRAAV